MNRLLMASMLALTAVATRPALADSYTESESVGRSGPFFGIGINAGEISCEDDGCDDFPEAVGVELHLGQMLGDNVALVLDGWIMAHKSDEVLLGGTLTVKNSIITMGPQWWLMPRLWIRGGVGLARASYEYDGIIGLEGETDTTLGITGVVGLELIASDHFGLDVQFRAGTGFYDEENIEAHNLALGVSVTWF